MSEQQEIQPDGLDVGVDHDWHMFDDQRGMEVAREGDIIWVRYTSDPDAITVLTPAEFDQLRSEGPNPRGLD